jgi:hypothetical protein
VTRICVSVGLLGLFLATIPQPAYAYIDPGLGSLLFQSVVAGLLAVGAAWAGFKMKIISLFDRSADKDKEKPEVKK